jgi:cbb3-type cytochrome oxidase maturation protein
MSVLIWLIPLALGMGVLGLAGFLWSLRSGQFDDLEGAAHRILMDDDQPLPDEVPDEVPDEALDQADALGEGEGEKSL